MARVVQTVLYKDDNGKTWPIRLDKRTVDAQVGAIATGAADNKLFATVSESKRKYGLHARYLRLKREVTGGTGGAAVTKTYYAKLAVVNKEDFANAAYAKGATVTVGGIDWTVTKQVGEEFN